MDKNQWEREYQNTLPDPQIICDKCGGVHYCWQEGLPQSTSVERNHPMNKNLGQNELDLRGYVTVFRDCAYCGRHLFADGKPLFRSAPDAGRGRGRIPGPGR